MEGHRRDAVVAVALQVMVELLDVEEGFRSVGVFGVGCRMADDVHGCDRNHTGSSYLLGELQLEPPALGAVRQLFELAVEVVEVVVVPVGLAGDQHPPRYMEVKTFSIDASSD